MTENVVLRTSPVSGRWAVDSSRLNYATANLDNLTPCFTDSDIGMAVETQVLGDRGISDSYLQEFETS